MEALEICNRLNMEAEHVTDSGFPLEVFPQKMQSIILDMVRLENYKVEYTAMSMLSAASAALGGTYRIRIKGEWDSNGALYLILVGRPGMGKTPPLKAAYKPICEHDNKLLRKYLRDMELYKAAQGEKGKGKDGDAGNTCGNTNIKDPVLQKTVISDFTPEAMMVRHRDNLRGIAINVDEIMGLFANTDRYGKNPLMEQLLTAWSGSPLDYIRIKDNMPTHIENPCINIVGTTQTRRMKELMKPKYVDIGLLDRILLIYPKSQQMPHWKLDKTAQPSGLSASERWKVVIDRILALDFKTVTASTDDDTDNTAFPHIIDMDDEASRHYFDWWNRNVDAINAIANDEDVDSRIMKHTTHVARLALLLQVLKYACDESHLEFITADTVKGALRLNDYCEESYQRCSAFVADDLCDDPPKELLELLPGSFDTKTALTIGKENMNITERSVMNYLSELTKARLIKRVKKGVYEKVKYAVLGTNTDCK